MAPEVVNPGEPETPVTPAPAKQKRTKKEKEERRARKLAATGDTEATETSGEAPYYCPGCGRRWKFMTECRGASNAAPHPPIEVVSTDELSGDPERHTAAPASPTGF